MFGSIHNFTPPSVTLFRSLYGAYETTTAKSWGTDSSTKSPGIQFSGSPSFKTYTLLFIYFFFCKLLNPMHVPAVCILNDIFNVIWRYSFSRQFTSHDKSHFQSLFQLSDKWLCDKAVKSWPRFVLKLCGCCFSSIKEPTLDLTEDSPVLSLPVAESAGSLIQLLQKEGIVCLCSEFSFFFSGFDSSP